MSSSRPIGRRGRTATIHTSSPGIGRRCRTWRHRPNRGGNRSASARRGTGIRSGAGSCPSIRWGGRCWGGAGIGCATTRAVFQRLKGHGKDFLAAALLVAAAFGPVCFSHWENGQPVGRDNDAAWTQITAVSKDQCANTMKLFPVIISQEARALYGIQVSRENVWGLGDTRQIQATSNNYLALEGNRTTDSVKNEPQNWNASNQGHQLAGTIDGNAAKIPAGMGRILDIQNAFRPGEDSVAERVRLAWEATQASEHRDAKALDFGMLYDSLEAHPEAPLTVEALPEVLQTVRGDSTWLDIPSIVQSILNGANTPAESRRKWLNQITATDEQWLTAAQWDPCFRDEQPVAGDRVVAFFDGSKSDDATALVGCRLSDGLVFPLGIWQRPANAARGWKVDRGLVDHTVKEMFETYNVHGLWADLSDARDDETGERYWEPYADGWAQENRHALSRLPAVKTGINQHLVNWDIRNPVHLQMFTGAAERFVTDVNEGLLVHNCPPLKGGVRTLMRQHVLNAQRYGNKFGVSVRKEHPDSRRKIDAAVCAIGARLMWHHLSGQTQKGRAPGDGSIMTWKW
jgi:hypothetical protein